MRAYLPVLLYAALFAGTVKAEPPQRLPLNGCGSSTLAHQADPSFGPAKLLRLDCLQLPSTSFTSSPPVVSPDGKSFFLYQYARGLLVGSLETGALIHTFPFDPTFVKFVWIDDIPSKLLFHWNSDSEWIWAGDQRTGPGHFAAGPVSPFLVSRIGDQQPLRLLTARAGPLDGLMWIGGDGLALAQFGTRGGYYRPEHSDPEPMLAFVDLKHGKFLNWVALKEFPKAVTAQGNPYVPMNIATAMLPNGRPRAVFQWPSGYSLVWTQGSKPTEINLPKLPWLAQMTLTSDGRGLLITYPLSGVIATCEGDGPCPPPVFVTGKYAELVDIETGKTVWANSGTAKFFGTGMEPAVSPDGRYALIGIPNTRGHPIGLVSMNDGKVLQTFPGIWSLWSAAFAPDSRHFYITGGSYVATYEITER